MTDPTPIDAAQLARIESTHKGFLYQHLIGVACMFHVAAGHGTAVLVERDEDIEVDRTDGHWYIQVKNLKDPLRPGDVEPSLKLFEDVRAAHLGGRRTGTPRFFIVSSSEPSPHLVRDLAAGTWPSDVEVVTPKRPSGHLSFEVHQDVVRQWRYAVDLARTVPLTRATPETLTWKLTAIVQALATGAFADGRHRATHADVTELFEHVVALVDHLPQPPGRYLPQDHEPELTSDQSVRIVAGAGGSGKTSWAAQAALHAPIEIVYARAGETEGRSFAAWIASHLIANLVRDDRSAVADAFRPGALGSEAVRLVDQLLLSQHRQVLVIVDDAHVLDDDAAAAVVRATSGMHWLLIGRPSESLSRLSGRLAIDVAPLNGWAPDTIAQVMSERGVVCDPKSIVDARRVTGGAPLLVENIAQLAAVEGISLGSYLRNLQAGEHPHTTALEQLLQRDVVQHLPPTSRDVAAALTFVRTPLPLGAIRALAQALNGGEPAEIGAAVRALVDWRVLMSMDAGGYGLHDTFRPLAVQRRAALNSHQRAEAARVIKEHLEAALRAGTGSAYHLVDYMRALGDLGELDVLADVASGAEEWFREHGVTDDVEAVLARAINEAQGSPTGRFLVADSLAFMAIEAGDRERAARWVGTQVDLLKSIPVVNPDLLGRLATKRVLLAKLDKDLPAAVSALQAAFTWLPKSSPPGRVLRYNFALVAMDAGRLDVVEEAMEVLIAEYLGDMGLTFEGVFAANPPEIWAQLGPGDHTDELRHAADCCFLMGCVTAMKQEPTSFEFLWAMKFYDMANAPTSALRAGVEVVDQLLWSLAAPDPQQAVRLLETAILPAMERQGLAGHLLELHSLYAVALACVGRFADARRVLRSLEPFHAGLNPQDLAVTQRRTAMVEGLANGSLRYFHGLLLDRKGLPAFTEPIDG